MSTQAEKGCLYTLHDNGVHEFVFTGKGETGVDEFFEQLEAILRDTPTDETLRYIVDSTQAGGKSPMSELVRRFRKLEARIPQTTRAAGRTAIIHDGSVLLTLANTFVNTLAPGKDKTRFFTDKERDSAWQWVLADS